MLRPPSYTDAFELPAGAVVSVRLDFTPVDWTAKLAGNPALKLSEESHLLTTGSFGSVALVAQQEARTDDEAIAAAGEAARAAGTAVVVVGLTEDDETEMADKQTLALPGRQDELVRRVAAAAERTVVVVNAATPVLMPWLDDVHAVLVAGLPGQEGGNAPAPLFSFGHGLGYGSWDYSNARLLPDEVGTAVVEVDITNTGSRASRETVQAYFLPAEEGQPVRLAGYAGSQVKAGETTTFRISCDRRLFRRSDETKNTWKPLYDGELIIARGLGDVRACLPLT